MSKPIVAIVGRPNVGKSTLFNVLAGEKISIVQDTPGVTRDRIYADINWLDYNFTLIDTGGIEPESDNIILKSMREQAEIAIETADVILFMTDVRQGMVDDDAKVADMLRRSKKPIVLVVNKVDSFEKFMPDVYEFYNLGLGDPHPISGSSRLGIGDMLDEVVSHFNESAKDDTEDERPRIAIIGKPNVGKSSLMNNLLNEARAIVTEIPGTTRDTIEEHLSIKGIPVRLTDTAGIRETDDLIEKMGIEKSKESFNHADLVIFIMDSSRELSQEDLEIIEHLEQQKAIVVLNKIDLKQVVFCEQIAEMLPKAVIIETSMEKQQGIDLIEDKIVDMVYGGKVSQSDSVMVTNVRHKNLLMSAEKSVDDAIEMTKKKEALEFIEIDVNSSYEALGEIIGETVQDDIINEVFARFCLGK